MESETKKCPYCGGEIMVEAKKCRHCGEWLVEKEDTTPVVKKEKKKLDTGYAVNLLAAAVWPLLVLIAVLIFGEAIFESAYDIVDVNKITATINIVIAVFVVLGLAGFIHWEVNRAIKEIKKKQDD